MKTGGEMKIHSKVPNCSYFKAPELVNLTSPRGEKSEIITRLLFKRKLQQYQEEITKTNSNQIKPNKLSKNKETHTQRKHLPKKKELILTN